MLKAFFFAIAAKEVWVAVILRNGSLRGKKAATPLVAALGGMVGPISVYLGLAAFLGSDVYDAVARGWAIPTATDIALSYFVGRIVFGAGHPAVRFLLILTIAADAAGLIILAIFLSLWRFGARLAAAVAGRRRRRLRPFRLASAKARPRQSTASAVHMDAAEAVVLTLSGRGMPVLVRLLGIGPASGAGAFADRSGHPACGPGVRHLLGGRTVPDGPLEPSRTHAEASGRDYPFLLWPYECRRRVFRDCRPDLACSRGPSDRQAARHSPAGAGLPRVRCVSGFRQVCGSSICS